jgi:hypothetical protein
VKTLVQRERVSALPSALEMRRIVERTLEQVSKLNDETAVRHLVETAPVVGAATAVIPRSRQSLATITSDALMTA